MYILTFFNDPQYMQLYTKFLIVIVWFFSGNLNLSYDWLQNLDNLKESMRLATSVNWDDVDLKQFPGSQG